MTEKVFVMSLWGVPMFRDDEVSSADCRQDGFSPRIVPKIISNCSFSEDLVVAIDREAVFSSFADSCSFEVIDFSLSVFSFNLGEGGRGVKPLEVFDNGGEEILDIEGVKVQPLRNKNVIKRITYLRIIIIITIYKS